MQADAKKRRRGVISNNGSSGEARSPFYAKALCRRFFAAICTSTMQDSASPHSFFSPGVPLNGLAWNPEGSTLAAAGGDGLLYLIRPGMAEPFTISLNPESSLLALASTPHGFITGNDAGELHLTSPQGETLLVASVRGQFIEHIVYHPDLDAVLFSCGKKLGLLRLADTSATPLWLTEAYPLPSSIGGLAPSPIGRRVAASHYNGVSIFDLANPKNPPRLLSWKGSHLALTYSPDGKWLISAMQEQAIHLWRLSDGLDLQMRGYPGKISQLAWSHDGTLLGTDGGSGVPLWNFRDKLKGPAGQQARVVADSGSVDTLVTALALHPKGPFSAVGYSDGLALLTQYDQDKAVLLLHPEYGPVSRFAWTPDGLHLATATGNGTLILTDFTQLASL